MLTALFSGCATDDNAVSNVSDAQFETHFGAAASRDFIGQVVDTENHPLQGVAINIGNAQAQTDVNGVFMIDNANVREKFAYITAVKSGYVDGSRAMVPTSGRNQVKIMMLPLTPLQSVASGNASEVSMADGTKINFDGDFKNSDGTDYSGDVSVSMFRLAPSNENLQYLMPGMLMGKNADGQLRGLETLGMLSVELRGSGGQKLEIAEGHTADISIKIDDSQLATAPASIPLWSFDQAAGYWKQEGNATREGNFYKATVKHFCWWNCDAQFPTVTLTVNIKDASGNPLSDVRVDLVPAGGLPRSGISDSNGQISGLVPSGETFTMQVFGSCGDAVANSTIGPFSTDTTLGDIVVSSAQASSVQIDGTLAQCDGSPVTEGYVLLSYAGQSFAATVSSGNFLFSTLACLSTTDSFTLTGFDYANLQATGGINYQFTAPQTHVGNLTACGAISEFISYQSDNDPPTYIFSNLGASANGQAGNVPPSVISIYGYIDTVHKIFINGDTADPGTYTFPDFQMGYGGIQPLATPVFTYHLVSVGPVGGYIDIDFSGYYTGSDGNTHTYVCTAHVLRDQ